MISEKEVVAALKTVYDPEIPVDIYELGLIYDIKIEADASLYVKMTLTSPNCPVAESLPAEVEQKLRDLPGISFAKVGLVFEPPWSQSMMSDSAKLELNLF